MAKQCLSLMNIQVATRQYVRKYYFEILIFYSLEKTQPSKMAHSIEVEKELISTEPEVFVILILGF